MSGRWLFSRSTSGGWSLALRLANLTTGLVTIGIVARSQGAVRFGAWSVLVSVVTGLLFLDLGLGNALVRESATLIARSDRSGAIRLMVAAQRLVLLRVGLPSCILACVGAVLIAASGFTTEALSTADAVGSVLTVGLLVPLVALLGIAPRVRVGLGEVGPSAAIQCVGCAVQVVSAALLGPQPLTIGLLVAINFLSQLVGFGLDTVLLRRSLATFAPTGVPDSIKVEGRHFMVLAAAAFVGFGADAVLVGTLVGPASAALVALAAKIVLTPQGVVASYFGPQWGVIARHEAARPEQLSRVVWRTMAAGSASTTAVCILAGVLAEPLTRIVAGPGYRIPPAVLWATVLAGSVLGTAGVTAIAVNGLGQVARWTRIAVVSALLNLTLGIALCISVGAAGAPLATALAHGLVGVPLSVTLVQSRLRELAHRD